MNMNHLMGSVGQVEVKKGMSAEVFNEAFFTIASWSWRKS